MDRHPTALLVVPLLALLGGQALAAAEVAGAWPYTAPAAALSLALCLAGAVSRFGRREDAPELPAPAARDHEPAQGAARASATPPAASRTGRFSAFRGTPGAGLRLGLLGLVCALAFQWGFSAHRELLRPRLPAGHVGELAPRRGPVFIEGRLYREPEGQGGGSRWHLAAQREWTPEGARRATGNIRVTVRNAYRHWRYGDVVRVPLRLRAPRNWDAHFDYASYLARRGIYRVAYLHNDWEVQLVRRPRGGVRGWIEAGRRRIARFVERVFEPETGALLKALVVGDRGGLTRGMREEFAAAGMSHVLAISGLHVGMLSLAVWLLFRAAASRSTWLLLRFPVHKLAALGSLAPVLLYAALAGARIPTVRAAIMIGLVQLAVLSGRRGSLFRGLALAALIVGLVWPGAVMEASFQLSFLAVLFIAGGMTLFRTAFFTEAPPPGWPRRAGRAVLLSALVPVFATLGTGPVAAHHFGILSLAGFVANPLLVPLAGFFIVPAGLLMGFMCLFTPAGSALLAGVVEPAAAFFLWAVGLLAGLPMAALSLPRPGWAMVAASYLLILTATACAHGLRRRAGARARGDS